MCWCRCLSGHNTEAALQSHLQYCESIEPAVVVMPEDSVLKFQGHHKMLKCPYVIYADFESLIKPLEGDKRGSTTRDSQHEACSFCYVVVRADGQMTSSDLYRGRDAASVFFTKMEQEEETIREDLSNIIPMDLTQVSIIDTCA